MSLKAIKWALLAVVHDSEDKSKCTKCRADAEIAALEKAAKMLDGCAIEFLPTRRYADQHDAVNLLSTIAKEAE